MTCEWGTLPECHTCVCDAQELQLRLLESAGVYTAEGPDINLISFPSPILAEWVAWPHPHFGLWVLMEIT